MISVSLSCGKTQTETWQPLDRSSDQWRDVAATSRTKTGSASGFEGPEADRVEHARDVILIRKPIKRDSLSSR